MSACERFELGISRQKFRGQETSTAGLGHGIHGQATFIYGARCIFSWRFRNAIEPITEISFNTGDGRTQKAEAQPYLFDRYHS